MDGDPLGGPASQRQRLAILAFVAGSGGSVSRDRLLAMLWPEAEAGRARHALSNALYALRSALGEGALTGSGDELRLDPAMVSVDVLEFEAAVRSQNLRRAVGLYAGPFLDGFSINTVEFERWADSLRARLADRLAGALDALASDALGQGDAPEEVNWRRRLAAQDPYSSRYAIALMAALERAGDPAGAIRHARIHATLLAQDLDAPPDAQVVGLAEEIKARMSEAPPPADVPTAASGVPGPPKTPPAGSDPAPRGRASNAPSLVSRVALWALGATVVLVAVAGIRRGPAGSAAAAASTIRTLAVLPLDDLSPEANQEYFAVAMTEILTAELSRLDSLSVVSRTSAARFQNSDLALPEIARRLGVDGLIEGSVFRSGDQVRVTAQLVHGPSDQHLWAESYEADADDPIALQRQVAEAVAQALSLRLSAREQARLAAPGVDPAAQEAFFQGLYHFRRFTPEAVQSAVEDFRLAAQRDSLFAEPAAMLAVSYWILSQPMGEVPPGEGMPEARRWAERAIRLDPRSADAHSALGWVTLLYERNRSGAERHFRTAVDQQPGAAVGHNGLAFAQMMAGQPDDAIAAGRKAASLNPLDLSFRTALAELFYLARRYDQALAELDAVLSIDPYFARAQSIRAWVFEAQADWDQAIRAHQRWFELAFQHRPAERRRIAMRSDVPRTREGYWQWRLEGIEQDLNDGSTDPTMVAWALAGLGDADGALDFLETAREQRYGQVMFLGIQPTWDSLRGHPRFDAMLVDLGLDLLPPGA